MTDLLANPIWHSLSTEHAHLSEGNLLAKRYRCDIGPLCGLPEQSPQSWSALAGLLSPGQFGVLFLNEEPRPSNDLALATHFLVEQMVCEELLALPSRDVEIHDLAEKDVNEMIALTELTEPGPFGPRTIDLGGYRGIRVGRRLVGMAGQRTAVPGYREVSAVCTHPEYRGRGYAAALVSAVSKGIAAQGEIPCLHVRQNNVNAIHVYERLGFCIRRTFYCAVVSIP